MSQKLPNRQYFPQGTSDEIWGKYHNHLSSLRRFIENKGLLPADDLSALLERLPANKRDFHDRKWLDPILETLCRPDQHAPQRARILAEILPFVFFDFNATVEISSFFHEKLKRVIKDSAGSYNLDHPGIAVLEMLSEYCEELKLPKHISRSFLEELDSVHDWQASTVVRGQPVHMLDCVLAFDPAANQFYIERPRIYKNTPIERKAAVRDSLIAFSFGLAVLDADLTFMRSYAKTSKKKISEREVFKQTVTHVTARIARFLVECHKNDHLIDPDVTRRIMERSPAGYWARSQIEMLNQARLIESIFQPRHEALRRRAVYRNSGTPIVERAPHIPTHRSRKRSFSLRD